MSGQRVRAFVAVLLPEDVRARLAAAAAELRARAPGLAWVRADNLHLTLRFLGEVEPVTLERVREALAVAATTVAPFTVALGGLGGFPPGRAPRVVWAGVVAGSEGLGVLHAALEEKPGATWVTRTVNQACFFTCPITRSVGTVYILKLLRGPAPPKFLTGISPRVLWGERAEAVRFRTKEEAILAAERLRSHGTIGVEYR